MRSCVSRTASLRGAIAVIALACALYFPFLGRSGFAHSEGFRVYPGWEMLDTGEWVVPHLFGQAYMRKPPLVPWLHAASASLFGRGEQVARSVSSLAVVGICVVSWWYARRWFGERWGLWAGLSAAVLPLMYWYPPGRAAEIEPIHNFFVLASACLVLDEQRERSIAPRVVRWVLLAILLSAMMLAKGPAGLPVVVCALCAVAVARRDWLALWRPDVLGAIVVGLLALGAWWWAAWSRIERTGAEPVIEPATRFLFREGKLLSVIALPVAALLTALPHSLALIASPMRTGWHDVRRRAASALGWTLVLSLLLYALMGVSNTRYASPALMLVPMCVGAAGWWWWGGGGVVHADRASRSRLARAVFITLLVVAIVHITWAEHRRATRTSGKPDAQRLGEVLTAEPGARIELWGDQLVDVRPEVLWVACRRASERGHSITPRWKPYRGDVERLVPPPGSYFIVRADTMPREPGDESEAGRMERALLSHNSVVVYEGTAHNFLYRVYRVGGPVAAEEHENP